MNAVVVVVIVVGVVGAVVNFIKRMETSSVVCFRFLFRDSRLSESCKYKYTNVNIVRAHTTKSHNNSYNEYTMV